MASRQSTRDTGMGVSIIASTVIHLTVFLLLFWWGNLFPARMAMQETYYVDVVNLPVASPSAGSPTQTGGNAEAPPPPAPENRMAQPVAPLPGKTVKQTKNLKAADKDKSESEADEFGKRMARLEGKAESHQQDAVLERLARKVTATGSGRSGMPAANGGEAGSRYEDYIKSRLEDALKLTSSYSTKSPEVVVRLVIAVDGKISRKRIERSSGDRMFELAVLRAIDIASEKFTPPPNHKAFDSGFIFKPKGISNNNSR